MPTYYTFVLFVGLLGYGLILLPMFLSANSIIALSAEECARMQVEPDRLAMQSLMFIMVLQLAVFLLFGLNAVSVEIADPLGVGPIDLPIENMALTLDSRIVALVHSVPTLNLSLDTIMLVKDSTSTKYRVARRASFA